MRRERATELLIEMLRRLDAGGTWQLDVIQELCLFGSYARGATTPGDVDLAADFDHRRPEWKEHLLTSLSYGRDAHAALRVALRGRTRSLSVVFERDQHGDIPMTLVWRRGDVLQDAIDRVLSIQVDASAGRAQRDALPAYLRRLGDKIPRFLRQELVELVDNGVITVEEVDLPEDRPSATWIDEFIDHRWAPTSPLRRAALAVLAHWERRGVDLSGVHLHGTDLDYYTASTPYFTGFQLRYFPAVRRCFTDHDGEEWIEVVAPTRSGPVRALLVRRGPAFAAAGWPWSGASYFT